MSIKFDRKFVNKIKKGEKLEKEELEALKTIYEAQTSLDEDSVEDNEDKDLDSKKDEDVKKVDEKEDKKEDKEDVKQPETKEDKKLETGDANKDKEAELELTELDILRNKVRLLEKQVNQKNKKVVKDVGEDGVPTSKTKVNSGYQSSIM